MWPIFSILAILQDQLIDQCYTDNWILLYTYKEVCTVHRWCIGLFSSHFACYWFWYASKNFHPDDIFSILDSSFKVDSIKIENIIRKTIILIRWDFWIIRLTHYSLMQLGTTYPCKKLFTFKLNAYIDFENLGCKCLIRKNYVKMQGFVVCRDTRQLVLADNVPITRFEVSATARRKLELLAMPSSLLRLSRVFDFQDERWMVLIKYTHRFCHCNWTENCQLKNQSMLQQIFSKTWKTQRSLNYLVQAK